MHIKRVFDTGFETFELSDGDGKVTLRVSSSSLPPDIEAAKKAENLTPDMQTTLDKWLKKSMPKESKPKQSDWRSIGDNFSSKTAKDQNRKTRDSHSRRTP